MSNDSIDHVAIAIGGVGLLVACISLVLFVFSLILFCKKINRLERRLNILLGDRRKSSVEEGRGIGSMGMSELSKVARSESKDSIPTPTLSRPVKSHGDHSYENTKISVQDGSTEQSGKVERPSESYADVPASLPPFLMNSDMLAVPEVTEEAVNSAQKDFDESYARLSVVLPQTITQNDYMDPEDARDIVATSKTHEKLDKRVSKSKQSSETNSNTSPSHEVKRMPTDSREDYTLVSDALPEGLLEKMENSLRPRTASDTSQIRKKTSPFLKKKSESLNRPGYVPNSKSQPGKRRSTAAKEMVTFDPKAGFKLSAHRSTSDGTPQLMKHKELNPVVSAPQTPAEEDKNISHVLPPDVGGKHVYAAVDLTAKCRPESDLVRREGVGTPDHYVACV